MELSELLGVIDVKKLKESILADLVTGDLLDKLYATLKPSILKAIQEAAK